MTTKLKSKSNIALLIVCVAALLAVGARWIVWPLLRYPLLYGTMISFESVLWNAAYAVVYTTPLLALLGHACFRGVSYKADYVLPFVYALLAVRPLVELVDWLQWFDLEEILYFFSIYTLFDLLETACLVLFGFSALLVAVLCLCKVRNRVAVLPVVLSGAVYLLIYGANVVYNMITISFEFFDITYLIGMCSNFLLLLLAEVLLFTALLIAGTGRKRPKAAVPVEDAAQPEPIIETAPEVAVEEPVEEPAEEPEAVIEEESVAPSAAVAASFSVADEIAKFKALMDQGVITAEEFEQKKKQLLNS